jgi:hypothetical protein
MELRKIGEEKHSKLHQKDLGDRLKISKELKRDKSNKKLGGRTTRSDCHHH